MAKDPASRPSRSGAARGKSAAAIRSELERTDRELLKLANQRTRLAMQLQRMAREEGPTDAAPAPGIELSDFPNKVLESNKGPLPEATARTLFRELISAARALEHPVRVAFLGPAYSYSHLATLERFGSSIEQVPVGSISAVFEEVNRGHADYGVVPVENSTDGRIADTLDMFTRLPVRICGEVLLEIHHSLLGLCTREEVAEVYSRPQALSQCRNWLSRHLPGARTIEVTSTSTAAKLAKEKPGAAAIASVEAGAYYGLNVLAERIEDNTTNVTRFVVIGEHSAGRTGHDKTSAMFEVEHRPGGLADAINIFKRNRLNLTWIESFPIPNSEGRYLFFIELDGHETDAKMRRAMQALERKALRLEILGSYRKSKPVG